MTIIHPDKTRFIIESHPKNRNNGLFEVSFSIPQPNGNTYYQLTKIGKNNKPLKVTIEMNNNSLNNYARIAGDNETVTTPKLAEKEEKPLTGVVRLQGIGLCNGIMAREIKVGDTLVWNQGYTSKVKTILFSASGKTMEIIEVYKDDKEYTRKLKSDRLVVIKR